MEREYLEKLYCKRCEHKWFPRADESKQCPKCKSYYWEEDRTTPHIRKKRIIETPELQEIRKGFRERLNKKIVKNKIVKKRLVNKNKFIETYN